MACRFGSEKCLTDANDKLRELLNNNRIVHQNNRNAVYCAGVRNATDEDYLKMWDRLRAETVSAERLSLISGLACTRNTTRLTDYIQTTVASAESGIRFPLQSERYRVFNDIAGNGINGTTVAVKFLFDNFDAAASSYGNSNVNNAITRLANFVITEELRTEVINFTDGHFVFQIYLFFHLIFSSLPKYLKQLP